MRGNGKRILSLVLTICMVFSLLVTTIHAESTAGSSGTAGITGQNVNTYANTSGATGMGSGNGSTYSYSPVTEKEVLFEDFDTKPSDWKDVKTAYSVNTAATGETYLSLTGTSGSYFYYQNGGWHDFEVSMRIFFPASSAGTWLQLNFSTPGSDSAKNQRLYLRGFATDVVAYDNANTAQSALKPTLWDDNWHTVSAKVMDNTMTISVDGTEIKSYTGANFNPGLSTVGLKITGTTYQVDWVKVVSYDFQDLLSSEVVLNEDFSDEDTMVNWGYKDSNVGEYYNNGSQMVSTVYSGAATGPTAYYNGGDWLNAEVSVDASFPDRSQVKGNWFHVGLRGGSSSDADGYGVRFYNLGSGTSMAVFDASGNKLTGSSIDFEGSIAKFFDGNVHNVRVQLIYNTIRAYIDNILVLEETNANLTGKRGGPALTSYTNGQTFDNLVVKSFDANVGSHLYVSPTGSDANPGTQEKPLATFAMAAYLAQPGTTVHFLDGTYYESATAVMYNSGTKEAPIIYKAENTGNVKIVYTGLVSQDKIRIANKEYITIQGLEITQSERATSSSKSPNLDVIVRCNYSNNISFINNNIHNAYEEPLKINHCSGVLVDGNEIYDSVCDGIDLVNVADSIIRNNDIHDIGRTALMCKGGSRSIQFYNNVVHNDDTSIGANAKAFDFGGATDNISTWSAAEGAYEAYNILFFNNIIKGSFKYGISFFGAKDCAAYNNIVDGVKYAVYFAKSNNMSMQWGWNPPTVNPVLKNNIFINCTEANVYTFVETPTNLVSDYNLFYGNSGTAPTEAHSIYQNPKLDSNYMPQSGSPAINKGTNISSFTGYYGNTISLGFDHNGNVRTGTWDIGCKESGASSSYSFSGVTYQGEEAINRISDIMAPQGTTILNENFSTNTSLTGWGKSGSWSVSSSKLSGKGFIGYGDGLGWSDVAFSADVKAPSSGSSYSSGILFRADENLQNMYGFGFTGDNTRQVAMYRWVGGVRTTLISFEYAWNSGSTYELKVVASGGNFEFFIDGTRVGSFTDRTFTCGTVGVFATGSNTTADNLLVKSAKGASITVDELFAPEVTNEYLFQESQNTSLTNWVQIRGNWSLSGGAMQSTTTSLSEIIYKNGYNWQNYELSVDVTYPEDGGMWAGLMFGVQYNGSKITSGYGFRFVNDDLQVVKATGTGGWTQIGIKALSGYERGTKHTMAVTVEGNRFRLLMDGKVIWTETRYQLQTGYNADKTAHISGTIGLFSQNMKAGFSGITVRKIDDLPLMRLAARNISVTDSLAITYKAMPTLADYSDYGVKFERQAVGGSRITDIKEYSVESSTGRYMFKLMNIAPYMMNDNIITTVYGTYKGLEYQQSLEWSVAEYCYTTMNKSTSSQALRTALVDMLYYGEMARLYKGYNTDKTIIADLTSTQKAWATTTIPNMVNNTNKNLNPVGSPSATWKSAGLELMDTVIVRLGFVPNAGVDVNSLTVKITAPNISGKEWTFTASDFEAYQTSDGSTGYYVRIKDLSFVHVRQPLHATVYQNGTAVSNTLQYSAEYYAANNYSKGGTMGDALLAMMRFIDSVIAYKNS